jgi:hypothetical protein
VSSVAGPVIEVCALENALFNSSDGTNFRRIEPPDPAHDFWADTEAYCLRATEFGTQDDKKRDCALDRHDSSRQGARGAGDGFAKRIVAKVTRKNALGSLGPLA